MSSLRDTPIVSIYDLVMERRRKHASESQLKDFSIGARNGIRRKVEEEASPSSREWKRNLQLPRKRVLRATASLRTLESESTRPPNAVTASHLTKKQTFMKLQPPVKKEIIAKLVEKMSIVRTRPKAESVDRQPPQKSPNPKSKKGSRTHRKEMTNLGTSRNKQKPGKSSSSLGNRQPLSPKKPNRGPKEKADRIPKEKTPLTATPKIPKTPKTPKTSRLPMRKAKQSEGSVKNAPLSTDRWRV